MTLKRFDYIYKLAVLTDDEIKKLLLQEKHKQEEEKVGPVETTKTIEEGVPTITVKPKTVKPETVYHKPGEIIEEKPIESAPPKETVYEGEIYLGGKKIAPEVYWVKECPVCSFDNNIDRTTCGNCKRVYKKLWELAKNSDFNPYNYDIRDTFSRRRFLDHLSSTGASPYDAKTLEHIFLTKGETILPSKPVAKDPEKIGFYTKFNFLLDRMNKSVKGKKYYKTSQIAAMLDMDDKTFSELAAANGWDVAKVQQLSIDAPGGTPGEVFRQHLGIWDIEKLKKLVPDIFERAQQTRLETHMGKLQEFQQRIQHSQELQKEVKQDYQKDPNLEQFRALQALRENVSDQFEKTFKGIRLAAKREGASLKTPEDRRSFVSTIAETEKFPQDADTLLQVFNLVAKKRKLEKKVGKKYDKYRSRIRAAIEENREAEEEKDKLLEYLERKGLLPKEASIKILQKLGADFLEQEKVEPGLYKLEFKGSHPTRGNWEYSKKLNIDPKLAKFIGTQHGSLAAWLEVRIPVLNLHKLGAAEYQVKMNITAPNGQQKQLDFFVAPNGTIWDNKEEWERVKPPVFQMPEDKSPFLYGKEKPKPTELELPKTEKQESKKYLVVDKKFWRRWRNPENGEMFPYSEFTPEEAAELGLELKYIPNIKNYLVSVFVDDEGNNIGVSTKTAIVKMVPTAEKVNKPTHPKLLKRIKKVFDEMLTNPSYSPQEQEIIKQRLNQVYEEKVGEYYPQSDAWEQKGVPEQQIKSTGNWVGYAGISKPPFHNAGAPAKWVLGLEQPPETVEIIENPRHFIK